MKTKEEAINVKGIDGVEWHSIAGKYLSEHTSQFLLKFLGSVTHRASKTDLTICNSMAYASANGLRWNDRMVKDLYEKQDRDWQVAMCVVEELRKRGWVCGQLQKMITRYK